MVGRQEGQEAAPSRRKRVLTPEFGKILANIQTSWGVNFSGHWSLSRLLGGQNSSDQSPIPASFLGIFPNFLKNAELVCKGRALLRVFTSTPTGAP
jgi:hypothetical protein